tara:strand:+ start:1601 stop:3133 length:1533 start_codon:yes stop_codon:yes gene_type:complete
MSQSVPSKFVSLVPTNGTEFSVTNGQKVIFELQPSLGLVKGRDSYLVFDILNSSADNKRTMLSNTAGASGLIQRVDIYSLRTGQHLETMDNYNQMASLVNQYLFEDKTNLQSLEGCGEKVYSYEERSGAAETVRNDSENINNNMLSPINTSGELVANFRRYTIPLKAGIFRYWDEERLCPVISLQGLRIELTLADPKESCFQMTSKDDSGNTKDPFVNGIACADLAAAGTVVTTSADYGINGCALAVGNQVEVTSNVATLNTTITAIAANAGSPKKLDITLADQQAISTGIAVKLRGETRALKVRPEFRLLSIAPPQSVIQDMVKGVNYEFTSYDHHVDNIPQGARKHLIELNSVATRAVCVMSQFSNVNDLSGPVSSSYYTGDSPDALNLNEVVYFLKGRLVPVRPYDPRTTKEKIVSQHELIKSWNAINKDAKDLGNFDGKNADFYTNTYVIGRQLARQPYYYDLANAEGQIRLGFSGTRTGDTLADTFVWSRKIVSVSEQGGMQVVL